jgi:hypothetical protein
MNLLAKHLTDRDGFSRRGNVLRSGAEILRLARAGDVSVMHLYQVALGTRRASWLLAQSLEHSTGGIVLAAEMLGTKSAAAASPHRKGGKGMK